jgi:putative copper export protein
MDIFFSFLHLLSLVCWIGSIVFFSFFAAPAIFKNLDRSDAGKVVGVIFPRYYVLGYICGTFVLLTLVMQGFEVSRVKLGLVLVMLVCSVFAGFGIGPNARKIKERLQGSISREEKDSLERKFKKFHRLSVQLNGTTLLAGLVLLWFTAEGLAL